MRKVLIIIGICLAIIVLGMAVYFYIIPKFNGENRQIDQWISANNLNSYGDPANTAYSAGAPCDSTLACYDYIKKTHPDKPWEK